LVSREKKLRKLANDDENFVYYTNSIEEEMETYLPIDDYVSNDPNAPENNNATANNSEVEVNKPVSTTTKEIYNKNASVQINKIHSFSASEDSDLVMFRINFYFYKRRIPRYIIFRLRINYNSRLRNLETKAESARTDCESIITDLVGKDTDDGQSVNYYCNTLATLGNPTDANYAINTDVSLMMVEESGNVTSYNFSDVNFNGDADEESTSIQEHEETIYHSFILEDAVVYINNPFLIISGKIKNSNRRRNLQAIEQKVTLKIRDENNETQSYSCTPEEKDSELVLTCDTTGNSLRTTLEKMHLSVGNTSDSLIIIKMADIEKNSSFIIEPESTPGSGSGNGTSPFFKKSSSGLSGGAIAGIIIACVAVLAAAAIAAIMLKKPSAPIDSTATVLQLKTQENL
jgi:uncharacterized spore protein YtfJ